MGNVDLNSNNITSQIPGVQLGHLVPNPNPKVGSAPRRGRHAKLNHTTPSPTYQHSKCIQSTYRCMGLIIKIVIPICLLKIILVFPIFRPIYHPALKIHHFPQNRRVSHCFHFPRPACPQCSIHGLEDCCRLECFVRYFSLVLVVDQHIDDCLGGLCRKKSIERPDGKD